MLETYLITIEYMSERLTMLYVLGQEKTEEFEKLKSELAILQRKYKAAKELMKGYKLC